jgi:hypothetical protein
MPGHRPVGGLGRAGGDVQPQPGPVGTHRPTGGRARSAGRPTGAQRHLPGQLGPQVPAGLQVDRLVDRLVRHPHLRPVGELDTKPGGDLLRGPPSPQPPQHYPAQPAAHRQLRTPWTRPDPHRRPVRTRRFVGHLRPVEGHRMPMQEWVATSRAIVVCDRPSPTAICRQDCPRANPNAISSRSAKLNRAATPTTSV